MNLLLLLVLFHPYHVSVSEIRFNKEAHSLQITERIFLDDLEQALRVSTNNEEFVMMEDSAVTNQYLQKYFESHFEIAIDGVNITFQYLGSEMEDDVIWCYLEVPDVDTFNSIKLVNQILTETFDDQKNLVHFKIGDEKKSFILSESDFTAEYHY